MLLILYNFVLVHRRIQAGNSRATSAFITSQVVFQGAPQPTMHAIARIGLVDYYGSVFTANDPHWKPKEARKSHNRGQHPAENVPPRPGTPTLQGPTPSTAPAGPIWLKFWLMTRKSILNKVKSIKFLHQTVQQLE